MSEQPTASATSGHQAGNQAGSRPTVLVLNDFYLPGFRAGGVLRSIANMIALLGDEFAFRVMTRNRDDGVFTPYIGKPVGAWQRIGKAQVLYLSPRLMRPLPVCRFLRSTPHDVLYLNSLVSPTFSVIPLWLRWLRLVPRRPLVLAPNGELSPSALAIKPRRKRAYLALARALGLFRDAHWRASNPQEVELIREHFGADARIAVAGNLPAPPPDRDDLPDREPKRPGSLKLVFLSRVARIKNLDGALGMLREVKGDVRFDIYGPRDDMVYWAECERVMAELPRGVSVRYHGPVPSERVLPTLARYDLFVLTTHSESHGYAIPEALSAGCPVLISNRTPWSGLEAAGAGWDLPLEEPDRFTRAIQRCVDMGEDEHRALRERARAHGLALTRPGSDLATYRALFRGGA